MPVASVVVVLAVGHSPAAFEVRTAAVASVVLASGEPEARERSLVCSHGSNKLTNLPVEYRTVAVRCTTCHSFVHSCW